MIKTVAIIGGGPSGIAALYELLHTLKTGDSIFGEDHTKYDPALLAFDKITLFERNSSIGGTWCRSEAGKQYKDPDLPANLNGDENDPDSIFTRFPIPAELSDESVASNTTLESPLEIASSAEMTRMDKHQWKSTGIYEGLFTNIPHNLMSFSFTKDIESLPQPYHKHLKTLQPWEQVTSYLESVCDDHHLNDHIRLNSNVERVRKIEETGLWEITIRATDEQGIQKWYKEYYQGVILANGRTVPYFPVFQNMSAFTKNNPNTVIKHCKNIYKPGELLHKYKKILFIGCGVSTADLVQYCFPRPDNGSGGDSVFISRRTPRSMYDWVDHATYQSGIVGKPEIEAFSATSDEIKFIDGTTESGFDLILFCTGYHQYFPFLAKPQHWPVTSTDDQDLFYDYAFCKYDPSLTIVGTLYINFFFNRAEANSAAIAGVWSGYKTLPSVEELQSNQLMGNTPNSLKVWDINTRYIKYLIDKYAPKNRPNPMDSPIRQNAIRDFGEGFRIIGQLFTDLKEGRLTHDEILS